VTVVSEAKKRRTVLGAVFGAISGAALFAILYFASDANLFYAFLIPVGAAMGAGQMYMSRER
jgi:hypothetical protein